MNLTRRTLLAGAAGTALNVPFPAFGANGTASRKFSASRGASDAGHQKITLSRSGDVITIDLETRLKVRLLGIPVYRYSLNSREVWEGPQPPSLQPVCWIAVLGFRPKGASRSKSRSPKKGGPLWVSRTETCPAPTTISAES